MKLKRFFGLVLIAFLALVLVACGGKKNEETNYADLLNSYLLDIGSVIESDFTVDSKLTVGETSYDLTWTSSDSCVSIAKDAVDGTYTVVVTRPDAAKEVTLTVKLGDATKEFKFTVNPYTVYDFTGAYVFANDKAVVSADFDLDSSFTKWGKTATITWESMDEKYIKIEDGKAKVTATSAKTNVTLKATFSYGGETSVVRYTVTVFEEMDNMESINYWYTNTGVSQTLSGYVVSIATVYSSTYGNVSFYMIDDSMKAGYYIYRGLIDETEAAQLKNGVHVTVTGSTNTCYSGLYETNQKTGTVVVDETVEAIDPLTTVVDYDNEIISGTPSAVYRQSTLIKLNGWKITAKNAEPAVGASTVVLTVERDGVSVPLLVTKYVEGFFSPWADDADPKFTAFVTKYNELNVGDYIDVVGILGNYNGHEIDLVSADLITKTTEPAASAAKEAASVIAKAEFDKKYSEAKTIELTKSEGNVTVSWRLSKASSVAEVKDGKLVITPAEEEAQFTLIGTYAVGDWSTDVYYVIKVGVVDNTIKTIAAARELATGTETVIQGTVMAINTKGYILYDGTAAIYVYVAGATVEAEQTFAYAIGDTVKVAGKLDAYNGLIEYIPAETTQVEINASEATLVDYSALDIQNYVAAANTTYAQDLVQFTGTLSISNNKYFNIAIDGLETEQVSISNPTDAMKAMLADLDGKEITFTGYALGQSSNKYFNVMIVSIDSALTINGALAAPKGTTVTIEGQVVAASTKGYVVYDGTGAIYVYAKGSSNTDLQYVYFYEEDFITVTGVLDFYNVVELVPTAADYMVEEPESLYSQGKAEAMDAAAIAAYVSAENTDFPVKLVEINGKLTITESGYYNVTVGEGETTATVSLSNLTDEQKLDYENDTEYTIYGYAIGHSSNTYMNIIPCEYLAPLDPYQEVYKEGALYCNPAFTAENCSWGGQALTFGVNGFADIKEAIAAAEDGDEIYLQSGEYVLQDSTATANFVLNKHLKFYGPNANISGTAKQRYEEATIVQSSGSNAISYSNLLEFYGVEFKGKGIGFISHDYFLAVDGAKGIIIKNCLINNITSFLKVKDKAYGNYVVDSCYIHGINQFIAWMTGGTLVFVNNTIDGSDCGGVTNSVGSAFRFRGAVTAKIYHNTFLGDYETYPGYFEPNAYKGEDGLLDIQYNNFNCVENFYLANTVSGLDSKAFMNNNIYTNGMNEATELPANITNSLGGIVTDTNTYATIEDLEAAWAALGFKWAVVSFDANGGSDVDTTLYYDFATAVLPTTAKEGYTFDGWYNGDTKVETLTDAGVYTLTAKWIKIYTEVYVAGALYVNPAFTAESCSWGGQALTFGVDGFADLKAAIAAATEGQEIYLQAGEYVLVGRDDTATYELTKNVKIYGTNKGVSGTSDDRYPESVILSAGASGANVVLKSFVEFDGVEFYGRGTGYIGHDYFTAATGATGMTIKNSIVSNITSFLKVKDVTSGDYIVDNCKISNINQFFAWLNGGNLTFTNNYYDGANCGGVENSGGSSFRVRGVSNIVICHNTFVGNNNYTGWFEPNCASGENGSFIIEYNTFLGTTNFFLSTSQSSVTLKATMNNNFYADANGVATGVPANVTGGIATVTSDTTIYVAQETVDAAWNDSEYNNNKINYTITYDVNGGTAIENATFTNFTKVILATPVKEGYEFLGWYDGDTKVEALSKNADITLVASWAKLYTITYNFDGGTLNEETSKTVTTSTLPYTDLLTGVTKGEQILEGWYNGDTKVTEITEANDITLTAHYMDKPTGLIYKTVAELAAEYLADLAKYGGSNVSDAANIDTGVIDSSVMVNMLKDATLNEKWAWFYDALAGSDDTMKYTNITTSESAIKGFYLANICGFLTSTQHTDTYLGTVSADYSVKANSDAILAQGPTYEDSEPKELQYKTVDEIAAAYVADFKTYAGSNLSSATNIDTASIDSSSIVNMLGDATMNAKWAWLYNALFAAAGSPEGMEYTHADATVKGFYLANLCGFFTGTQHTDTYLGTVSADYTVEATVTAVLNAGPAASAN